MPEPAKDGAAPTTPSDPDVSSLSCSCEDFVGSRSRFPLNDPRRLCACLVTASLDCEPFPSELAAGRERVAAFRGDPHGYPMHCQIVCAELPGGSAAELFFPLDREHGWITVLAEGRRWSLDPRTMGWGAEGLPGQAAAIVEEVRRILTLGNVYDRPQRPAQVDEPFEDTTDETDLAQDRPNPPSEPGPAAASAAFAPSPAREGHWRQALAFGLLATAAALVLAWISVRAFGPRGGVPYRSAEVVQDGKNTATAPSGPKARQARREGVASKDLGYHPDDLDGAKGQAEAMLAFLQEQPGKALYVLSYYVDMGRVEFVCNFPKDALVRAITLPDGRTKAEVRRGWLLDRLRNAREDGGPGSLGMRPMSVESFDRP